jgi:hypothetical protein
MWHILDLISKWDKNYSCIQHSHYILITNALISSLIPTKWVHPNENFKIQQNKMVKTMYVPNTISIPTHKVDFSHQALGFREITRNRQWNRRKVRRGEERKKEREEREREEGLPYSTRKSRQDGWHDSFISRANWHGAILSMWHSTRQHGTTDTCQSYESR